MSHYDAAGEDLALQRRCGALEHDTIILRRDLKKLDREVVETRDLIVKMVGPVKASLDLTLTQLIATQKQVRKLFSLASKKRRKR